MPAFTPPPPAPQRGDRATFSSRVDAFLTWLVSLVAQLNIFVANLNERDLGGASTFVYNFDSNTADSDPGIGKISFNHNTQNMTTQIRIDNETVSRMFLVGYFDSLNSVTSNIKGYIRIQKVNDPSKWIFGDIFGAPAGTGGGYRNLQVNIRTSSSPNPFSNGDDLAVLIDRNGDKGDGGNTPTQQQMRDAIGTLGYENGGTNANSLAAAKVNFGIDKVSNTSDADKPVSNAQASALSQKYDKTGGEIGGPIIIPNTIPIRAKDASGATRVLLQVSDQNDVQMTNTGGQNFSIYNQAVSQIIFNLTNSGVASAFKFTATSDEREKKNWRAVPDDFLERFAAIERAGLFDWSETGETDGGIGAQSVREIAPWCVLEVDGKLRVNHAALNTVVSHALARRVLRNEAMQ